MIQANCPSLMNRESHLMYLKVLPENGFKIVCDKVFELPLKLLKRDLVKPFSTLVNENVNVSRVIV